MMFNKQNIILTKFKVAYPVFKMTDFRIEKDLPPSDNSRFGPDGKLASLKFLIKPSNEESTALGVCGRDGIVLAVELSQKLMHSEATGCVFQLNRDSACIYIGHHSSARKVLETTKEMVQNHLFLYEESVTVDEVVSMIIDLMRETIPIFQGSFLVGGLHDNGEPGLYYVSVDALPQRVERKVIGRNKDMISKELKLYAPVRYVKDLVNCVSQFLSKEKRVVIATITKEEGCRFVLERN